MLVYGAAAPPPGPVTCGRTLCARNSPSTSPPNVVCCYAVHGYGEARKAFPHPKHIPMQVAWDNAKANIKRGAAPIIG